MKTIPFLTLIALLLFVVSSCDKGGDLVDPPSKTELLGDGPWELSAQTVDPPVDYNGTPVSNEFAQLDACIKDNILTFVNGTYTINEGDSKCDEADPLIKEAGTWSLSDEEATITFDAESGAQTVRALTTLNRDQLVLTETFEDGGLTFTRIYTFDDID